MRRKIIIGVLCILGMLILIWYFNRPTLTPNKLDYFTAIDKVYNSDIKGMAVVISTTDNLHGSDARIYNSATGNKDNDFSVNSTDGVRLWAAKQLFISLKGLKVTREGLPEILKPNKGTYYMIQINAQYSGKSPDGINYLSLFVNSSNYHVYIPKEYYDSNRLVNLSIVYTEFDPNAVTKTLIKDIIS
jgi:hypothetical protein